MDQVIIDTALRSWDGVVTPLNRTFSAFTNEEMYEEIAPGRNRVIYILGHLTAVNDWMLPALGFGERLHPELEEIFLAKPDRIVEVLPGLSTVMNQWHDVNATVRGKLAELPREGWLAPHATVSADDFAADPLRHRLSVVNNRVGHMWFHLGQLALVRKNNLA